METGKIPPWVWIAAAAVVVIVALMARSRGAGGGVIVSNPPSDSALQTAAQSEQAVIAAKGAGFASLVNAIAGTATAGTIARRDVAGISIATQGASYQAGVDSITQQVRAGYSYFGTLAQEAGETERTRIEGYTAREIASMDYSTRLQLGLADDTTRRILGLAGEDTERQYITESGSVSRYLADHETRRALDTNRTSQNISFHRDDADERISFHRDDTSLDIAQEEGQTARYIAKKNRKKWYESVLDNVGGLAKFFGF